MKILFISSGKIGRVGDVVRNQGESLVTAGVDIEYYIIKPGFWGYLKSVPEIRKKYRFSNYDLAHAHYSLSGFTAALAGCKPLVVSLMGSDVFMSGLMRLISTYCYKYMWDTTIVKTQQMRELLNMEKAEVIPNGVNINRFKSIPKRETRNHLGYSLDKQTILFISAPNRREKNFELAEQAIRELNNSNIELKHINNVANTEIPYYLNAADALLVTSKWEGSVNIVKEAMACNCPIVSTDVGDVMWVLGNTNGCYIASFESHDIAEKIKAALDYGVRTDGRKRIIDLGLDSKTVADHLIQVYGKVLRKGKLK